MKRMVDGPQSVIEDTFGPPAKSAKLKKGTFMAIGVSYHDAGILPSKGISPNVKTGYPDGGER
jgi:hypothetical protein